MSIHKFFLDSCKLHDLSLESLLFWALGYGSWMGVGILPILWKNTNNPMIRLGMTVLSPSACAFSMATLFAILYFFGKFLVMIGSIMVHPGFVLSSLGTVSMAIVSLAIYFTITYVSPEKKSSDSDESASESNDCASESNDCASESNDCASESNDCASESNDCASESNDSENDSEGTPIDAESTDIEPDWRETANFDGLRNAPPLSE